jgi:hypothetical protein
MATVQVLRVTTALATAPALMLVQAANVVAASMLAMADVLARVPVRHVAHLAKAFHKLVIATVIAKTELLK